MLTASSYNGTRFLFRLTVIDSYKVAISLSLSDVLHRFIQGCYLAKSCHPLSCQRNSIYLLRRGLTSQWRDT